MKMTPTNKKTSRSYDNVNLKTDKLKNMQLNIILVGCVYMLISSYMDGFNSWKFYLLFKCRIHFLALFSY